MNDLSQSRFEPESRSVLHKPRQAERISFIRAAKLVLADGEYPCILRDISGDALRVRLYGKPALTDAVPFILEFGDGDRFEVSLIWQDDDHAGLRFADPNELLTLIGEQGPFQKRSVRIAVDLPTTVRSLGRVIPATIRNLSHHGAQIETDHAFSLDQQVRIAVPDLGEVYAKVRWRQHPQYGLAFVEMFQFEQMAEVAGNLQARSLEWRKARQSRDGGAHLAA